MVPSLADNSATWSTSLSGIFAFRCVCSGVMTFDEFERAFPKMDPEIRRQLFISMDVDDNGGVDFREFLSTIGILA